MRKDRIYDYETVIGNEALSSENSAYGWHYFIQSKSVCGSRFPVF